MQSCVLARLTNRLATRGLVRFAQVSRPHNDLASRAAWRSWQAACVARTYPRSVFDRCWMAAYARNVRQRVHLPLPRWRRVDMQPVGDSAVITTMTNVVTGDTHVVLYVNAAPWAVFKSGVIQRFPCAITGAPRSASAIRRLFAAVPPVCARPEAVCAETCTRCHLGTRCQCTRTEAPCWARTGAKTSSARLRDMCPAASTGTRRHAAGAGRRRQHAPPRLGVA